MTDPTKYVREMYVQGLAGICPVYDTFAPADRTPLYGVIVATSGEQMAIKNHFHVRFTVNLEIYEEFKEYGNSVGVDNASNLMLQILVPQPGSLLTLNGGYSQDEARLTAVSNDGGRNDAVVIFRKRLTIVHIIS